ncbi:hypothetical protein ACSBR2_004426 [Camellia fascicularis]
MDSRFCLLLVLSRARNLKSAVEFHYLSQSGCLAIDDVDDARKFQMLMEALDTVRLCKEDQDNAFEMLAAVLWLGNISFQVIDNENHVEVVYVTWTWVRVSGAGMYLEVGLIKS